MTFKDWDVARGLASAASILALAIAAPAWAQDAETEDEPDDLIIVTGSRIATDGTLTAVSPVLAVGGDDIRTSGQIDVTALLRENPALQGSLPGSFSAFNGTALGAGTLNLRSLGTIRTLVLENGRRHVPGIEGESAVDVNAISTALIERVDVMTGGASSIYGADAVTGVVNFITRNGASFDGLEVRAQAGITDDSDAEEFFISVANGYSFDDGRGSFVYAVEYQGAESVLAGDRDFAGSGRYFLQPSLVSPYSNYWIPDVTLPISSGGGVIALQDEDLFGYVSAFEEVLFGGGVPGCSTVGSQGFSTCQYFDNGTLRDYNPGDIYIDAFSASGGDAVPIEPDNEVLLPESDRVLFQASSEYQVHEYASFFFDAKYAFTRTLESNQVNGFNDDIPIALDNPFIPAALLAQVTQLQSEGINPAIAVSRDVLDVSARSNPVAERKTFRIVGGFTGEVEDLGLNYEISYNFGRTDSDITSRERLEDRYFAAIDAVVDPGTGEIVCRADIAGSGYVPPSSIYPAQNDNFGISTFVPGEGQCVPISIFGENSISQEGANWIFQSDTEQNTIEQRVFLATISGSTEPFFELPAGPISYAVGYEYRDEESLYQPGSYSAAGLTFGTIESNGGAVLPSVGAYDVSEIFFEAQVPLLADLPFVKLLEFRYAGRFSDYSTYGRQDTWSYGGRYSPTETLTFRATVSRAIRTPSISELFAPQFTVTLGAGADPCNPSNISAGSAFRFDNCVALIGGAVNDPGNAEYPYNSVNYVSARIPGSSGGNLELEPEVADTITIGGVWRPSGEFGGLLDGLVVTVDYYDIQIKDAIDSLSGQVIAENCVDAASINNQFCDAVDRDPTFGFITDFRSGFINLGELSVQGVDWRVQYSFDVSDILSGAGDLGSVRFGANGTRFLDSEEIRDPLNPSVKTDTTATFGRPNWIVNFTADWEIGDVELGWRGRYETTQFLPGIEPQDVINDPNYANVIYTGDSFVNDFSASYQVSETLELYAGINNAFEVEPYLGGLSRPAGPRGRFFYLGLNATF